MPGISGALGPKVMSFCKSASRQANYVPRRSIRSGIWGHVFCTSALKQTGELRAAEKYPQWYLGARFLHKCPQVERRKKVPRRSIRGGIWGHVFCKSALKYRDKLSAAEKYLQWHLGARFLQKWPQVERRRKCRGEVSAVASGGTYFAKVPSSRKAKKVPRRSIRSGIWGHVFCKSALK